MSPSPPVTTDLSPRRRQLLDAGLQVVADEGLRGLTHRAVDRQAGLPEGSCSAYLRTRKALLVALTEYVASSLAGDVDALARDLQGCPGESDRAVQLTRRLFQRWVEERELLLAKLELSLEASRDPELAELMATWRSRLVDVVDGIMAAQGKEHSAERAETLVSSFDGILFAALLKPRTARKDFLARSLQLLMTSMAAPGQG
ncbi:DNA-binding transcriptional regulator YbjK [Nocardioides ginsengisegetis]|uniref:DNA-binding transcriptional regulator YbjK n=1 Tax=Nocardioides ginsengisegetis TaxID=661491 RepID=A0A7W3PA26_9ACTN|nr:MULTISPECIES: TetR/AcrR family transcriptional regulator [Nocardioides]MBA8804315.1 DNA-binding transcriptional regulator YbjK [Nocardioides ginsengisegetis]